MQAMAQVVSGANPKALEEMGGAGFDPSFARVYRNNSVCALAEALTANYMSVENIVGEDYFTDLVIEYIKHYPDNERTLVGYGAKFIKIVQAHLPGHKLPYLPDCAQLDRAWTEAHLARDAAPLDITYLTNLGQSGTDLQQVKLQIIPGASIIKLAWPVFEIWQNIRAEQVIDKTIKMKKRKQYALVWRYENTVNYRELQPYEYRFLSAIQTGETLGRAMNSAITGAGQNLTEEDLTSLLPNAVGADLFAQHKV